jgi:hypothetical protein
MTYDEIVKKYPKLLKKLNYIECNVGWIDIIDLLCTQLEIINSKYPNPEDGIFAAQVKEKFGGLRFYVDTNNLSEQDYENMVNLINETESRSYKTCEMCSAPAKKVKYSTLCDQCSSTKLAT